MGIYGNILQCISFIGDQWIIQDVGVQEWIRDLKYDDTAMVMACAIDGRGQYAARYYFECNKKTVTMLTNIYDKMLHSDSSRLCKRTKFSKEINYW